MPQPKTYFQRQAAERKRRDKERQRQPVVATPPPPCRQPPKKERYLVHGTVAELKDIAVAFREAGWSMSIREESPDPNYLRPTGNRRFLFGNVPETFFGKWWAANMAAGGRPLSRY